MAAYEESPDWLSDYVVSVLQSPTWVIPIARFVDERCEIFDDADENKLEYTMCHGEYRNLVMELLSSHLSEVSVTPEQFSRFCQRGLSQNEQLHRALVEQLLSVDDFLTFKAMMARQNADLDQQVITLDQEEPQSPTTPIKAMANMVVTGSIADGLLSKDGRRGVEDGWELYDDDMQRAISYSKDDLEKQEAAMRVEEAQLAQAIALSLQVEEERVRQIAMQEEAAALAAASASASAPADPVPRSAGFRSMPLTMVLPNSSHPEAPPTPLPTVPRMLRVEPLQQAPPPLQVPTHAGFVSQPLCAVPPRIKGAEASEPPVVPGAPEAEAAAVAVDVEDMRAKIQDQRARAEHIVLSPRKSSLRANRLGLFTRTTEASSATSAAGAGRPHQISVHTGAASGGPSEEERRARAEHLRRQRDLLLQKRNADREQRLAAFNARMPSRSAAGVDMAWAGEVAAGRQRVAENTPGVVIASPAAPPLPDPAAAAEQMRKALTLQLRQNLVRSIPGTDATTLASQLDQLESRRENR